jgi:hypothetical protein
MKILTAVIFMLSVATGLQAQTGAKTTQDIGKALFNSLKNNNPAELSIYYPTLAELQIIKNAKATKDDTTILKFLAQSTAKKLGDNWLETKNKLEANGVIWTKADMPAVSNEPYQGDGKREYAVIQVMFKADGKNHVASAKCTQVNGLWYVTEDIKPHAQVVN